MFYFVDENNKVPDSEISDKDQGLLKRKRSSSFELNSRGAHIIPRKSTPGSIFTVYDRCDSLLSFPDSFVSCVNSGDHSSLHKLMKSRINQHCEITLLRQKLNVSTFVELWELMDELHPDMVMHVHTTKVVKNQVRARLFFKFTENKTLRNALARSMNRSKGLELCPESRTFLPKVVKSMAHRSEEDRQHVIDLVSRAEELVGFGSSLMSITFDEYSKHITNLEMKCEVPSFAAAPVVKSK